MKKGYYVDGERTHHERYPSGFASCCHRNGIPIKEVKEKVIEGWEDKAKGLMPCKLTHKSTSLTIIIALKVRRIYSAICKWNHFLTPSWKIVLTFKRRKQCYNQLLIRWVWKRTAFQSALIEAVLKTSTGEFS
jgi:hypothetical protein